MSFRFCYRSFSNYDKVHKVFFEASFVWIFRKWKGDGNPACKLDDRNFSTMLLLRHQCQDRVLMYKYTAIAARQTVARNKWTDYK